MHQKAFFNWSGGKDSALALYKAKTQSHYSIEKLVTNVNAAHRRISMHGVREELLELQAASIGLPLQKILLPEQPSMQEYEEASLNAFQQLNNEGYTHAFFGDIFLEDLRKYREEQLAKASIGCVFPLWGGSTSALLQEFVDTGFKAIVVCMNSDLLPKEFAGRIIDQEFIKDLPSTVDPCGENGEFHSFVCDGPIFKKPISFITGDVILKEYATPKDVNEKTAGKPMGFWFCDLLPDRI